MNFLFFSSHVAALIFIVSFSSLEGGYHEDKIDYLPGYDLMNDEINFSGYTPTVGGEKLFYWFHGSHDYDKKSTILWTNGGPGASSLWGFFLENGPYCISSDGSTLLKRKNSWCENFNYLIFEHPLGVTLSFSEDQYLPNNVEEGISHLYKAFLEFLGKHPEIANNPIILAGQSYAGTYLPIFANLIVEGNKKGDCNVSISKIVLLSPWIDPELQMSYDTSYAVTHGFISQEQKDELDVRLDKENLDKLNDEISRISQLNLANISQPSQLSFDPVLKYINNKEVRKAIHADVNGPLVLQGISSKIEKKYESTVNRSYLYLMQKLLDETDISFLIVSGLNDAKDTNFFGVEASLNKLKGYKAESFFKSIQIPWEEGKSEVLGFIKGGKYLKYLKVLNAGHNVACEQPLIINVIAEK